MNLYRLTENIGDYPKGLLVYVVESRGWMDYNDAGDWVRMSDGKAIGPPSIDNPRISGMSWCVERDYLTKYAHKFSKEDV